MRKDKLNELVFYLFRIIDAIHNPIIPHYPVNRSKNYIISRKISTFSRVFSIFNKKKKKKANWSKVNVSRELASFNEIPRIKKFNLFPSAKFSGKVKGRPRSRVKELHIVVSVHETVTVISSL